MPPNIIARGMDSQLRRWLSRGVVTKQAVERELLLDVLSIIGVAVPQDGLAALRAWGQSGERPDAWTAAADPVHYQARLRDIRLRSLPRDAKTALDLQEIFASLGDNFDPDDGYNFVCSDDRGYLRAAAKMPLPSVSAQVADGHVPDKFTPSGNEARAYHRLLGELQMFLHEHPVNVRRQDAGLPAINSLWLWGGGVAPASENHPLPDLYAADDLFKGYWAAAEAVARPWSNFSNCLESSPQGFVAILDALDLGAIVDCLRDLDAVFSRGNIRRLVVLFHDGLQVQMDRFDRFKVWRGMSPFLVQGDPGQIQIEERS